MKIIFTILCLFILSVSFGQRKYKDTVMAFTCVRIDWDTTVSGAAEMLVWSPGAGQVGGGTLTDTQYIPLYGPEFWLLNGWNGTVALGNGTHKPVIMTIIQNGSGGFTKPVFIKPVLDAFIASRFHGFAKDSAWHAMGFSAGGWLWSEYNSYLPTTGDFSYWNYFKSQVDIEGVVPSDQYDASLPYPQKFGNRATTRKFRFLGFEQINDTRGVWQIEQNINDSVPGTAWFAWSDFGSGGHSNFNDFINPSTTDWTVTNTNLLATANGEPSVFIAGGQNVFQWSLRQGDTTLTTSSPVAHAGGTVIVQEPVKTVLLNGSASTGSNLKYRWKYFPGYYANNVSTLVTTLFGESSFDNLKQYTSAQAVTSQIFLGTDSVHKYGYILTVTDSISGLTSTDTAYVVYRARTDYPPQNIDGSKGFHYWGSNPTYDNVHVPWGIAGDVVITGANQDPVNDASGTAHNMSFYCFPTQNDTFNILPGASRTIWLRGGHYRAFQIHGDSVGGVGMQLAGTATLPVTITEYDTALVTDFSFQLSNVRYVRWTGQYDPVNRTGLPLFAGAQNGYAYSESKYGFQCGAEWQYIGRSNAIIDGVSTSHFRVDHIEFGNGGAEGLVLKQDSLPSHNHFKWVYIDVDNCYFHDIFQEMLYFGPSTNPIMTIDSSVIYNNRFVVAGDKGEKTIAVGSGNYFHNNVVIGGGLNWLTPFEQNVCWPREFGFYNHGNIIRGEIYDEKGGADQVINVLHLDPPESNFVSPGENLISNCVIMGGHGYSNAFIGGPYNNTSPKYKIHFDSCYFGQTGPFNGSSVYSSGTPSSNTLFQISAQQGGGVTVMDTANVTNTQYDSSKYNLITGSIVTTQTNNALVKSNPYPQYVNAWFVPGTQIRFWCDTIYGTYRNEFSGQSGTKQGQLYSFNNGDTVYYRGDIYISRQGSNLGHVPQQITDSWWTYVTFPNGSHNRPDDIRLYATDPLAKKNIGLLDQLILGITVPVGYTIKTN